MKILHLACTWTEKEFGFFDGTSKQPEYDGAELDEWICNYCMATSLVVECDF